MTAGAHRAELVPAYVLHTRPWGEAGRIVELLTRDHGRLSAFAHGARGPKSRLAGLLQPFTALLVSWAGRGEAPRLTGAELAPGVPQTPLPSRCILPGFYLSELVMNLTVRHDPQPDLYGHYAAAVAALRAGAPLERELRLFEKRLLDVLGFGLDLAPALAADAASVYRYRPQDGLQPVVADGPGVIPAGALRSLAEERLDDPADLDAARTLLRAAIAHCLEGRSLKTRKVARSLHQQRRPA